VKMFEYLLYLCSIGINSRITRCDFFILHSSDHVPYSLCDAHVGKLGVVRSCGAEMTARRLVSSMVHTHGALRVDNTPTTLHPTYTDQMRGD
jgi:hypothetical protein